MIFENIHFRNIKGDIFGALTSAVVALPLALVDLSDIPREHFVDDLDTAKKLVGNLLRQADQKL